MPPGHFCEAVNIRVVPVANAPEGIRGKLRYGYYTILFTFCTDGFIKKKKKGQNSSEFCPFSGTRENLRVSLRRKAFAAVNSLAFGRFEGHLALLAALSADGRKHFSRTLLPILSCSTALFASLGLVFKAFGCVEFLLTGGEHEILATIFALQCLVLEHTFSFLA